MGMEFYAFATYVFVLVCLGMWLFFRLYKRTAKKAKEKDKSSYDKEQRLFTLYQNIEDLLASFEEYVEESKSEAQGATDEIKKLLEEAKRISSEEQAASDEPREMKPAALLQSVPRASSAVRAAYQAVKTAGNERPEPVLEIIHPPKREYNMPQSAKTAEWSIMKTADKVAVLFEKGLSKNEIAQQLAISVREVTLAMKVRNVQ